MQQPRNPGTADFKLRLLLARFGKQLGDLLHFQAADNVAIDADDIVARSQPGLLRRSPRGGLENDHAAREQRYNAAETLLRGCFHLLDLIELAGVEEDGVGVERAQQAGDGALVKDLFGRYGIGGVLLHQRIGMHDALHLGFQIVGCAESGDGTEKS